MQENVQQEDLPTEDTVSIENNLMEEDPGKSEAKYEPCQTSETVETVETLHWSCPRTEMLHTIRQSVQN